VAVRFTGPGDRFAGLPTVAGPHGLPLLPGTAGTLVCRRERILAAGDHLLLMGEVLDHRATPGPALLFADGAYHRGPDDLS
jgi:flavin reductase (DIM6/NTAB) family NADH-FMN oxidoreductase RutF